MNAQDVILGSRVAHVRELKTEVERLKADNQRLRDENAALSAHFELALVAAQDLRTLPAEGKYLIVDGWNLILGAGRQAGDPADLVARIKAELATRPDDFAWIVFDGPKENAWQDGRVRVSYTGGTGQHRADRFICDFMRMAKYLGLSERIEVRTHDRDFLGKIERIRRAAKLF